MSKDRRNICWQDILLYIALPMIFGISGFMMRDLYAEIKTIRETKIDRAEFYQAMGQLDKKTDLIIQLLRDHSGLEREKRNK